MGGNMPNPRDDGVTHVNVYSRGATLLGKLLSNFASVRFTVPEHGTFDSIEGYWYWLGCKDDRLRSLSGYAAKKVGRELRSSDWPSSPDFKSRILTALQAKYDASPTLRRLLSLNRLPFEHYYVFGDHVVDEKARNQWLLDFWASK
jgi:hypothetical protein